MLTRKTVRFAKYIDHFVFQQFIFFGSEQAKIDQTKIRVVKFLISKMTPAYKITLSEYLDNLIDGIFAKRLLWFVKIQNLVVIRVSFDLSSSDWSV